MKNNIIGLRNQLSGVISAWRKATIMSKPRNGCGIISGESGCHAAYRRHGENKY
jgi:hypothetical protein